MFLILVYRENFVRYSLKGLNSEQKLNVSLKFNKTTLRKTLQYGDRNNNVPTVAIFNVLNTVCNKP